MSRALLGHRAWPGGIGHKGREIGDSFWKSLAPSSSDRDHSYSQGSQPKADLPGSSWHHFSARTLRGAGWSGRHVWHLHGQGEEQVRGTLPSCSHAHCRAACVPGKSGDRTSYQTSRPVPGIMPIVATSPPTNSGRARRLRRGNSSEASRLGPASFLREESHCLFKYNCIYLGPRPQALVLSAQSMYSWLLWLICWAQQRS